MATADAVVVGAGLAGLTAAIRLAESGARVHVLARGHAATHWSAGTWDACALDGAATPRAGIDHLAKTSGHPYAVVGAHLVAAIPWLSDVVGSAGLPYVGDLDSPIRHTPTAVGRTRPVAIVPDAQSAGVRPWAPGEGLVVCGPTGFKDFWPGLIAAGLSRSAVWRGGPGPDRVDGLSVSLRGIAELRNLDGLRLARLFDDVAWRRTALEDIARAVARQRLGHGGRIALPAVLGLEDHAAALADARRILPLEPFEVPLPPPSVPGLRLYRALRAALLASGGRMQVGEPIARIEIVDGVISAVAAAAASREFRVRTGTVILATGGIAGGGLVAESSGTLREEVLGLPVEQPVPASWLAADAFEAGGHPLESAGIRTDAELRPIGPDGEIAGPREVRVAGSLLAGQRYLRERCGDGVAIGSGWLAAQAALP
jgi:glycerol-3-phosphate dehydrogenase subunit B